MVENNFDANEDVDLNEEKLITMKDEVGSRQIFEVFVVLRKDERVIAALSSTEISNKG